MFTSWLLLLVALVWGLTSPSLLASALDGRWAGVMTCSENLVNRNPAYTVPLELEISGVTGSFQRTDANAIEDFSYSLQPSGAMTLHSTGRLRSDMAPRWFTRLSGQAHGASSLEFVGQMFAPDGKTRVRERCTVSLLQSTPKTLSAPATKDQLSTVSTSLNHQTFQIREVAPKTKPLISAMTTAGPGGLPLGPGGVLYLPEDWLLGSGQAWHYRS